MNIKRSSGFTIVELLIVIVVIAILAAISVVAYTGIQSRANNARILSAVDGIEKAMQLWHVDTGKQPKAGYGSTGGIANDECNGSSGASGWFGGGLYSCNMEDLLASRNYLSSQYVNKLPPNKFYSGSITGQYDFMMYPCSQVQNGYMLYYTLYNPSQEDYDKFDAETMKCANSHPDSSLQYDRYGMRGGRIITLD